MVQIPQAVDIRPGRSLRGGESRRIQWIEPILHVDVSDSYAVVRRRPPVVRAGGVFGDGVDVGYEIDRIRQGDESTVRLLVCRDPAKRIGYVRHRRIEGGLARHLVDGVRDWIFG